jgi:vitamin B12 transporter
MLRHLVLVGCCSITSVLAQESGEPTETIVVTASRTPTKLEATGSSVAIIDRALIERRQAPFVGDLLRDVPGVAASRAGGFGTQTQLRLRGSEANHVLVLIDGIDASDPAIGDEFQFENLPSVGIERIEIVRGPQSALWGSDALGGVINIITRRPEAGVEAEGSYEAGSFDTQQAVGRFGLGRGKRAFGLDVARFETDGTNISRSGTENDGYRSNSANLSFRAEPTERIELDLLARYSDTVNEFDATDFATGLPSDAYRTTSAQRGYFKAGLRLAPEQGPEHGLRLTLLDSAGTNTADDTEIGSFGAEKLGLYYQGDLALDAAEAHRLTFALDHEQQRYRQRGPASPFGDPNHDQDLDTTGYVLEYRASLRNALELSASARRDVNSDFASVTTYRVTGSRPLGSGRTRLRSSIGSGQKSPTFVERFGFFPDVFLGNAALSPEQSKGWEVGFDHDFANDRVSLAATYFDEVLENEINGFVFDPARGQFTAANTAGRSHRAGVETAVWARISGAIDLAGSYTFLDSTQDDGNGAQIAEIRRPRHTASLNLNYAVSERANLNLNVFVNGGQLDTYFPPFPLPEQRIRLSSFRLVALAASFRLTERLEVFGRIENLLDEDYEEVYGFATPGAAAYVGLRARP